MTEMERVLKEIKDMVHQRRRWVKTCSTSFEEQVKDLYWLEKVVLKIVNKELKKQKEKNNLKNLKMELKSGKKKI